MFPVTLIAETSASPMRYSRSRGPTSPQRAKIWPNVTAKRLQLHPRGDRFAEVTEGGTNIAHFPWERSRCDWSQPGTVKQTVIDTNVLEPGSTCQLCVVPREGAAAR